MTNILNPSFDKYLRKHAAIRPLEGLFDRIRPYRYMVVIPALGEAETLPLTLQSLGANIPGNILENILVVIVVNNRLLDHLSTDNPTIYAEYRENNIRTLSWLKGVDNSQYQFQLAWIDAASPGHELPSWGGVGLARKIGCDSAIFNLNEHKTPISFSDIVLFSLDADAKVSTNYIETAARELLASKKPCATILFKHQKAESEEAQSAIDHYEAFLDYYVAGLRWAGSPYAFHTIGSCLCFTAAGYVRGNGFPARRQAGEDFYFCMKMAKTGGILEIDSTTVYPSARISYRVPFGTGRRMADTLHHDKKGIFVYDYRVYIALRELLSVISNQYDNDSNQIYNSLNLTATRLFLEKQGFPSIWARFCKQFRSKESRLFAFHCWFDGFVTLKYIHYLTDQLWPRLPVESLLNSDLPWSGGAT
jgi:hypothetical protein